MEKVHIILLSGMGDEYVYLVNDELWDWVQSDDRGREGANPEAMSWRDSIAPQLAYGDDELPPYLSANGFQNDRAMSCPLSCFDDIHIDHFQPDIGAMVKAIQEAGYEIGGTYTGALY